MKKVVGDCFVWLVGGHGQGLCGGDCEPCRSVMWLSSWVGEGIDEVHVYEDGSASFDAREGGWFDGLSEGPGDFMVRLNPRFVDCAVRCRLDELINEVDICDGV